MLKLLKKDEMQKEIHVKGIIASWYFYMVLFLALNIRDMVTQVFNDEILWIGLGGMIVYSLTCLLVKFNFGDKEGIKFDFKITMILMGVIWVALFIFLL